MTRFLLVALIATFSIKTNAQEKWSLQQCVAFAIKNNISVKQADVQARLSKITSQQSDASIYPSLTGNVNSAYQRGLTENPTTGTLIDQSFITGNTNVQIGYSLFTWGARKNNIDANKLLQKADELGIEKAQNDIALFVSNAFLQVMLRREQARISEVQMNQSRSQLGNMRKLVKAGSQPELSAIQIEAQLAKDSSNLLQAQSLIQQAMINLRGTMNIDFNTPFEIFTPEIEKIPIDNITDLQPEMVYNMALNTQPIQRMYKWRLEAGSMQIKAARASMYPDVSAFGGLNTRVINSKFPTGVILPAENTGAFVVVNGSKIDVLAPSFQQTGQAGIPLGRQIKNNFGQSLGLSINFSVFNNFNARTQWERAKIGIVQTKLQQDQENLTLKTNIYNAYQDAYASLQKYNATLRTVDYSQKAFDMSKKRLENGLLSTLDYIITQNNLYLAQIESVSNRYDYIFKMKVLEFYKGQGIKL